MSHDYDKAVDALMKDVKDLRADMKDVIAAIKAKAGDYIDSAKESLHESAAHRLEQVRDTANIVGRRCHDGLKSCAVKIEEHPFISLLAALGGGVILGGLILMRCRRR
jgi:ElaB/YqjD/DUF883 family membrane-anchored ribosome-binding protein